MWWRIAINGKDIPEFNPNLLLDFSGCFYSTAVGELRSYENPKNKITAVPALEEEIWGAKFMVIKFFILNYLTQFISQLISHYTVSHKNSYAKRI